MKVTLAQIPQPEELPPADRLFKLEDLNHYLSQLDPFMEFHGFKATEYRDWLKINCREVEAQLAQCRMEEFETKMQAAAEEREKEEEAESARRQEEDAEMDSEEPQEGADEERVTEQQEMTVEEGNNEEGANQEEEADQEVEAETDHDGQPEPENEHEEQSEEEEEADDDDEQQEVEDDDEEQEQEDEAEEQDEEEQESESEKAWKEILRNMQADKDTQLDTKIRSMPSMRLQNWIFDCGIFEKTMVVSALRFRALVTR